MMFEITWFLYFSIAVSFFLYAVRYFVADPRVNSINVSMNHKSLSLSLIFLSLLIIYLMHAKRVKYSIFDTTIRFKKKVKEKKEQPIVSLIY